MNKSRIILNSQSMLFLALIAFLFTAFGFSLKHSKQSFEEITVKRINVIESDGTIRMVLSNKELQHSGRMDGQDLSPRERQAGLIFFNDEGDEAGGLIYGLQKAGEGKVSFLTLTMDQYKNDQVIQILNQELIIGDEIQSMRGFAVNQFPEGSRLSQTMKAMEEAQKISDPIQMQQRMAEIQQTMGSRPVAFMGKGNDGNGLFLFDNDGLPKLMIYVDKEGNPRIQTIDESFNFIDLLGDND